MDVKELLPHREDMLLIDSVTLVDGVACGTKKIIGDEWFLRGHFPDNPVVPGVILCEILGQSACALFEEELRNEKDAIPMFTGLDRVRFKLPVRVGDTIETKVELIKSKKNFYWAEGRGYVNDKLCVRAEFSFVVIKEQ